MYIKNTYGDPLIYITENGKEISSLTLNPFNIIKIENTNRVPIVFLLGWVDKTDNTKTIEQARVDLERIDYHNKHLQSLRDAIRQGDAYN